MRSVKGFTLIELLIVIAVIGILAVAVLSAINPLEQIRKGSDAARKSDASEILGAMERYYTTFKCYPWDRDAAGVCDNTPTAVLGTTVASMKSGTTPGTMQNALNELLAQDEIKKQVLNRTKLDKMYVYQDSNDLTNVCFIPESKSMRALAKFQRDADTACTPGAGAYNEANATSCHVCLPE